MTPPSPPGEDNLTPPSPPGEDNLTPPSPFGEDNLTPPSPAGEDNLTPPSSPGVGFSALGLEAGGVGAVVSLLPLERATLGTVLVDFTGAAVGTGFVAGGGQERMAVKCGVCVCVLCV